MSKFLKSALLIVSAMLIVVSAYAQVTTSSLNGTVTDEAGEPLVGAVVTAVHTPTGTQYYAVANEKGQYHINGMRAGGPYKVSFVFLGMTGQEHNNINLQLGESFELNGTMKTTTQLDEVTVIADKSFNASRTGAGQAFSQSQIENLPTIDRTVYDVVKFTPQATVNKNGGISFSGANNRYNSFQVDGAVNNDSFGLSSSGTNGGQTGANPISMETIEEVQVVVAPFDVRQSGFTGGAINAITKSGTNQIKGSAYTYIYNQDFIGTTPGSEEQMKDNFSKTEREKYSNELSQTYGFTIGAPIVKNKLFLFASAEYYRKSYPNVYSPENGSYDNDKRRFANNIVWNGNNYGNTFDTKMADAILEKYSQSYCEGVDGYSESYGPHQIVDQSWNILARLDWNISRNHHLMARYQYMDAFADKYGSGASTYYFNNSSYKQTNKTNTAVVELNSRIGDNMANEFRATGVFVRDKRAPGYPGATMYIKDKITFDLGTEFSSGANSMNSDTYTLTDNFSIFAGNHNITIGTHNEFFRFNNVFIQYAYGEYTFATLQDFFDNKWNQYDYKFSDPKMTGGNTMWAAPTYALELGLYAQDEWKANRNFTLTYGLRVDFPMLLNNPTTNDVFNATDISKASGEKVGTVPAVQPLFSPRLGFRWYTDREHTSLLRGGLGLFTGRVPFVWLSNAYNNTGIESKSITITKNHGADVLAGIPTTSDPYNKVIPYLESKGISASAAGATINTLNRNFKYPQVFRVNLGYDKDFEGGWRLTLDALYSKTLNNVFFDNLAIAKSGNVYGVNPSVPGSAAPYYSVVNKDYSAIVALSNTNKGYSYSLSAQIQKHFEFGLDLMASYTYGHSYSVNDGTSSVAYSNWKYNYSIDTKSPDELSYSLFDRPHKVNAVISYTSPVYARVLRTTVSLTYTGDSGQRYTYTMKEPNYDFNGDGQYGNSNLYIPSADELPMMNWSNAASAAKFESFIRNDRYLNSHRGQWSERNAGIAPFEHHFDLQVAEDIFYDRTSRRKVQILVNFLNVSNLLCRSWGMYHAPTYNRTVLQVDNLTKDAAGNMTPTYSFYDDNAIKLSEFYSRWRCQLGVRVTF